MTDAIVVGAGIAGLSAAYRLQESGHDVVVLEEAPRVGGIIRSERVDGYLLEHGPHSIQSRTPLIDRYVDELALSNERIEAAKAARVRYLVKHGRPVAAPVSPTALLTSSLFGPGAKLRLMREPFVPAAPPDADETVAQFVRRRLGREFLDYAMNPFVAGVFAGDPERLSVKHAFPSLLELERKHGSIIKGQLESRRGAAGLTETGRMFSFRDGMEQLTIALARRLNGVRTGHRVEAVSGSSEGWQVNTSRGELRARSVVCTTPLHRFSDLSLPDALPIETLSRVRYAPLSVVYQGYRRRAVRHPLDGFGLLVPEVERDFHILGTLFTSSIFPGRAPDGEVLLTTFVGGTRNPDLASRSEDELHQVVRNDLKVLLGLGLGDEPTLRRRVFWPHAIPQYTRGYDAVIEAVDQAEARMPGFFLAGNYRQGVSVGDTACSGDDAGSRCDAYLRA